MGGAVSAGVDNDDLIDKLLNAEYIKTPAVERVLRSVDRGFYFLPEFRHQAYCDMAWKNGNLHLSAPCIYSEVLEQLNVKPGLSFLNIGSGTGYLSTVVGLILGPNGVNHGVEIHDDVVKYAYEKLEEFKRTCNGVDIFEFCEPQFSVGNGFYLNPDRKYDRIYCGAACPEEYHQHIKQYMKIGGILIVPWNDDLLKIIRHSETEWEVFSVLQVSFSIMQLPQQSNSSDMINFETNPLCLQALCRSNIRSILRTVAENENPWLRTYRRKSSSKKRRLDFEVIPTFTDQETDIELDELPTRNVGLFFYQFGVQQQRRQQLQQVQQQEASRAESEDRVENENSDENERNDDGEQSGVGENSSQTGRVQCKSYLARYILNKTTSSNSNAEAATSKNEPRADSCRKRAVQTDWNQLVNVDGDQPGISDESDSEHSSSTTKHIEDDEMNESRKTPSTDEEASKSTRNDCSPSKKVCREHELTPKRDEVDCDQKTTDDNQSKKMGKREKLDSGISEESDGDGKIMNAVTKERLSSSSSSQSTCSEAMDVDSDFIDSDFIDSSYPPHQVRRSTRDDSSSSETDDSTDEDSEDDEDDNNNDKNDDDESNAKDGTKFDVNIDTLTVKYRTLMEEKIQMLPLPYAIKSYLNYNREFKFTNENVKDSK